MTREQNLALAKRRALEALERTSPDRNLHAVRTMLETLATHPDNRGTIPSSLVHEGFKAAQAWSDAETRKWIEGFQ